MFDLALQTVRNKAVRLDFSKARRVLEEHGTFGDAFNEIFLRIMVFSITMSIVGTILMCLTYSGGR